MSSTLLIYAFSDMQSEKPNFSQPGDVRKTKVPRDYMCNRASGLSAALQNQRSIESEKVAETNCWICGAVYSREDQMVYTKCCNEAIGSYCNAQDIAKHGKCWNRDEEEVQSKAASEAKSWIPYDLKDPIKEAPRLPQTVTSLPAKGAGHQPATAMLKAGSILPSGSTTQGSNTPSFFNTRESERSQNIQPLCIGLTEEQCAREVAMYRSQSAKESSKVVRMLPQSSPNLKDGNVKENSLLNGGSDQAKATSPKQQEFLHNGSESASSDFSQDVHQHLGGLTQKEQERQVAKQYVIGATKHLVEMCNTYGNEIDEADKDEIMNEVLEAVRGCKTFEAAIKRMVLGRPSTLTTRPASIQSQATVDTPDFQSVETRASCSKCEELQSRMKKAADALLGL